MSRGLIALAVWGSIQLFFISSLSLLLVKVNQIYRIVRRYEAYCRRAVHEVQQVEQAIVEKQA